MEISSTTGATTKTGSAAPATGSGDDTTAISGDFETFLKLLTAQMRNQDPLQPMDSTEFVSQLASFSGVEQQVRANDRLQGILDLLAGGDTAGLAAWIGREVQAASKADFTGAPVEVAVTPVDGADSAVLVVKNDFDQVVARIPVAADATSVSWDGSDSMGGTAAEGRYGFSFDSYQGENLLGTEQGKVYSEVSEIRLVDGAPVLVVADGTQVPISEVGGVR